MNSHRVHLVRPMAAWVVLFVSGVLLLASAPKRASALGPTPLSESERALIIGGCGNGDANCKCSNGACGGTVNGCSTTMPTCVAGPGQNQCQKLVTVNVDFCGAPNSDNPKGCTDEIIQGSHCGQVWIYNPAPQGGCTGASCGKFRFLQPCGDPNRSCQDN